MATLLMSVLCYIPPVWIKCLQRLMQCTYLEIFASLLCCISSFLYHVYIFFGLLFFGGIHPPVLSWESHHEREVSWDSLLWKCHYSMFLLRSRSKGWKTFLFKCWSQCSFSCFLCRYWELRAFWFLILFIWSSVFSF